MRSRRLRHRLTLQRPTQQQDPVTGEMQAASWESVASVWASVEPLSARDLIAAQAQASEVTARVVIRYRPDVAATWRALHNGRVYTLQGPPLRDPESGRQWLTLLVSEGLKDV